MLSPPDSSSDLEDPSPLSASPATDSSGVSEAIAAAIGSGGKGRKRKRADQPSSKEQLVDRAFTLIQAAWSESTQSVARTALRRLNQWISDYDIKEPFKMTLGDPAASLYNELTLLQWVTSMDEDRLAHGTIASYVSLAKTSLGTRLGWAVTGQGYEMRLPRLLKGIRNTRPSTTRKRRLGLRARHMRELRARVAAPSGVEATGADAVLNAARQGLLRAADFLPKYARAWHKDLFPTVGDLEELTSASGRYATILVRPAKKRGNRPKGELVHYPEGDGVTDAFSSIHRHLAARRTAASAEPSPDEPLFVHRDGRPWTIREMRQLIRTVALLLGLPPAEFGAHSARIGGATDLFAEGCPAAVIQILGRWYRTRHCPLFPIPTKAARREDSTTTTARARARPASLAILSPESLSFFPFPIPSIYYLLLSTTIYYYLLLSTTIYYPLSRSHLLYPPSPRIRLVPSRLYAPPS